MTEVERIPPLEGYMTEVEFALLERLKEAHIEIGELRQTILDLERKLDLRTPPCGDPKCNVAGCRP